MKKLVFGAVILSLLLVFAPLTSAQQLPESYIDPDGTLMLNYPRGWRVVKSDGRYEFIIPNDRFSLALFVNEFDDDPIESLELWSSVEDDAEIEPFLTPGGKTAARIIVHSYLTTAYYAISLDDETTLTLLFIGGRGDHSFQEENLLGLLDSIAVPGASDMPAEIESAAAIELSANYEQGNFSFAYPEDWFYGAYQGKVAISNIQGRAQYREPEYVVVNTGETVVLVYPDIASLPGLSRRLLEGDDLSLDNVSTIMAISLLVEGGTTMDFDGETLEIGNYEAMVTPLFSEKEDYLLIVLELPEDRYVTVIGVVEPGELADFENTFLAIAESVAVAE